MVGPEFEVDPAEVLRKALLRASKKVDDLTIPLRLIAQQWFKSNRAIFTLKGPGKYADLSMKPFFAYWEKGEFKREYESGYKEYKQAKVGFIYPILKRNGLLEASVTDPSNPNAIEYIINKKALVLGTSVDYAHFHQEGTKFMPARPIVLFGNEQVAPGALKTRVERWEEEIAVYVQQVTDSA